MRASMGTGRRVAIEDGVAWIALDDGKVNAMSTEMIGEIVAALDAAEARARSSCCAAATGCSRRASTSATFKRGLEATVEMLARGRRR